MGTSGAAPAPTLTEAELKLLQTLVYQECGMYFDERRAHFLQDRLQRRLKECRLDSFLQLLPAADQPRARTNSRSCSKISPSTKPASSATSRNSNCSRKTFWKNCCTASRSAAIVRCASGARDARPARKPTRMAMLVADALAYYYLRNPLPFEMPSPKPLIPPPWKVEILASDISYSVLRAGQEGTYSEHQMATVDYTYRLRYFDKVGDRYAIKKALKEMVHFDFHNLKTEFLPQRNDVIFCRNVMMYFDEAEQKRLIDKFYRCLNPDGYLFVGHAESLLGLTEKFQMVHQRQRDRLSADRGASSERILLTSAARNCGNSSLRRAGTAAGAERRSAEAGEDIPAMRRSCAASGARCTPEGRLRPPAAIAN